MKNKNYFTQNDGNYPKWCNVNNSNLNLNARLGTILHMLKNDYDKKHIRDLINDINNYLEKQKGFHYGYSKEFERQKENGVEEFVPEHAVPSKIVIEQLKSEFDKGKCNTTGSILNFIRNTFYVCLITVDEDNRLRAAELKEKMPAGWKWGNDWKARYNHNEVNIKLIERILKINTERRTGLKNLHSHLNKET